VKDVAYLKKLTILLLLLSALNFAATYPEEVLMELINQHRAEYNLAPLETNWEAARVARHKCEDMKLYNYFAHHSPVYGSFFDTLDNFNIPYQSAGENIATGYSEPEAVVKAWMASPNHRKNILSKTFTEAGVGYATDGFNHYWALILISSSTG